MILCWKEKSYFFIFFHSYHFQRDLGEDSMLRYTTENMAENEVTQSLESLPIVVEKEFGNDHFEIPHFEIPMVNFHILIKCV